MKDQPKPPREQQIDGVSDEDRIERHNRVWDKVIGPALEEAFEPSGH